jgi:hypothetical protein
LAIEPLEQCAPIRSVDSTMRYGAMLMAIVAAVFVGGCTTTGGTPATAPSTTMPVAVTTTTIASATTAAEPTTTTLDRLSEITAIFEDLEHRRLQAIYDQDEEAFRALYANEEYRDQSLGLMDQVKFVGTPDRYVVSVLTIVVSKPQCIAATIETDLSGITEGGGRATKQQVIELRGSNWGISYVGDDWACDGPHPLLG